MAFSLKKLADEDRDGFITMPNGDKLNFKYKPYAYTPDHEDLVEIAREESKAGNTLKAMIIPLLAEWDVVNEIPRREEDEAGNLIAVRGDDGEIIYDQVPVPITEEGIGPVPIAILNMLMSAIIDDMSVGKTKSTTSEGSFA